MERVRPCIPQDLDCRAHHDQRAVRYRQNLSLLLLDLPPTSDVLGRMGMPLHWFPASVLAFGACYAAFIGETYRAGIQSVDPGQREAARALGLTHRQAMRTVVLPQANSTVSAATPAGPTRLDAAVDWVVEHAPRRSAVVVISAPSLSPATKKAVSRGAQS